MIFSSNAFIFAFLPVALAGYYLTARLSHGAANAWLVIASLVFYSYWNPWSLLILLASISWNFSIGTWIFSMNEARDRPRLVLLWLGIVGNLLLLGYFKYFFPMVDFLAFHGLIDHGWISQVVLPLGISFFTFTQIGFLIDSYDGRAKERGVLSYMVFVTFFPHLIAGPILHNREILPQICDPDTKKLRGENFAVGLSIFAVGIGKKVLIADPFGFVADAGFSQVHALGPGAAWITVLAYSLQLYFDFSGYSDMAIGLARLFGIVFPVNFNSPYKAASIIDFWARWHMTLTRYLTLYLYNPIAMRMNRRRVARGLSVSRKGTRNVPAFLSLVALPIFTTMGLAGVWHGAGLQFVIFGLLHASYLSINHAWRMIRPPQPDPRWWQTGIGILLTYSAVLLGQIFFRAASTNDAVAVTASMFGATTTDLAVPAASLTTLLRIALGFSICLMLPNTQQIFRNFRPVIEKVAPARGITLTWRPTLGWAIVIGMLLLAALLRMSDVSKLLYFQF